MMISEHSWGCDGSLADEKPAAAMPVVVDVLSGEERDRFVAAVRECERIVVFHEAGHALMACFLARPVRHVDARTEKPHCGYGHAKITGEDLISCVVAGPVAEAIARRAIIPPHPDVMLAYVRKVRAGGNCGCDGCQAARYLVILHGDDEAVVAAWRASFLRVADLFDTLAFRAALHQLADALERTGRLDGDEVVRIVKPESLRNAVSAEIALRHDRLAAPFSPWGL